MRLSRCLASHTIILVTDEDEGVIYLEIGHVTIWFTTENFLTIMIIITHTFREDDLIHWKVLFIRVLHSKFLSQPFISPS